ncbi:uncharacterized protein LOC143298775 isoform X2 [Babylonia areolata]|uniref:uncharacterized protein LOC143298775 isoform X2 n=1 Tax=Babylonia areolata TaxID=304850 RepID=UPI003FCF24B0
MDRYQRVRKIGEGAFGKAVLVRHKQTNRQCVVKEINIVKMPPKEREDARKEVSVLAQLKHPNIVSYIESFEEAGTLYIVMNYCSGGDLYGRINNQHGRLFTEDQVLNWFVQICLAMKHIHDRKILHRDIKSQNIFLSSSGVVQLGDFGIAKVLNNTVELARTCIGTPYYLSPEIVENKPYNNKSDIWSLGCVLYELTTLKHAFEAGNMKNLVLKIIRGSYPPISPQYSYDLRGLIAQLFKRAPRDRPSINVILKKNFIMERVRKLMSAEQLQDEFSHTVMHGAKLAKALPPAPRPSSAPKKSVTPRPGSAGRGRYNPASVYGVPIGRKSQNRSSGDQKKRGGGAAGGVNRPVPVPGQQLDDQMARRHQNLVEKQKMDRINKAREDGWKNLLGSSDDKSEARPQTPKNAGDARPLPVPRQKPAGQSNGDNRGARDPGNYEEHYAYLEKLKAQKLEREKALDQKKDYMAAPAPLPSDPNAPPAVQAAMAINQANYDRQKGAQAAERARIVEDYMQRRQAAAANKARGRADLMGNRPPSGRGRPLPSPAPKPAAGKQYPIQGRNKNEQEYLERLRQIREQNMRDRKNQLQQRAGIKSPVDREAEERKKKAEGLKKQAEDWAKKKKEQLEKERQDLFRQQQDRAKQQPQAAGNGNRPGSAKANMTPAPAVPITGMLHLIGAGNKAAPPPAGQEQATPAEEEATKSVQQRKSDILKRLNEKPPSRGKWGADKEEVKPVAEEGEGEGEVQLRRAWGEEAVSPLADPQSARSQWGDDQVRLSDLPLEQTGSAMEATSARDKVVMNPADLEAPKSARNQWGRPGSTVVRALNQLPVCQGTVSLSSTEESVAQSPTSPPAGKPAIGSTITISKTPTPAPTSTSQPPTTTTATTTSSSSPPLAPTPSAKPPVQSGTIVLKAAEASASATSAATAVTTPTATTAAAASATITIAAADSAEEGVEKAGKKDVTEPTPLSSNPDNAEPLIGETELPGSNRFVEPNSAEVRADHHKLSTVFEVSRDFTESDASRMVEGEHEDSKSQSVSKPGGARDRSMDVGDSGKPMTGDKPELKPKPGVKPKPPVAQKPLLLPKPQLLSKPDLPYHFSEQAPVVVSGGEEGQAVFSKAPAAVEKDKTGSNSKADSAQQAESLQKGLCTGNFDMKNVQMLRTCSEPDLARLFRSTVQCVKATLRRHQSLDLAEGDSEQDDELSVKSLSPREDAENESGSPEPNAKNEEVKDEEAEEKNDDDDEGTHAEGEEEDDNVDEEEDEDLISMRETMQSLLLEDDDGDEEGALSPKIKFSLSSDAESTLKEEDSGNDNAEVQDELRKQLEKLQKDDDSSDDKDDDDELASKTVCPRGHVKSKSDSALTRNEGAGKEEEEEKGAAGDAGNNGEDDDDDDDDDDEGEKLVYSVDDILTLTLSKYCDQL